jgi:hypothetical protein
VTQSLPNGTAVLLAIDGDIVGSQRDVMRDETTAEVDTSSKDAREMSVIAGRYGSTISLDALYVPDDSGYERLKAAMRNGSLITAIWEEEGSVIESASALVTSISEKAPDQDAATVSVNLRISGAWVSGS